MQNFNNEIVKALEDIKGRRDEVSAEISRQQEEKEALEQQIAALSSKLTALNSTAAQPLESIAEHVQLRDTYDKTIAESESAYVKILESSQTLLHVLKREGATLTRRSFKS
eukprot:TRINITY_DN6459_c0_g4_i3.p1 TRINITY_DN6459_c0_g4~~TRINITY_DN6459_c0_g4_i3.p1  ORF type:complete len:111 (-),score=34.75 TRINITY_DN6459_c0_g4_i3:632-964(-)